MTWIIALWANPLARKFIIYGAAFLAVCYGGRLWLNKHDSRIEQEARVKMSGELAKAKQKEWAAKEEAIAQAAQNTDAVKHVIEAEKAQLLQDRASLSRSLSNSLAAIQKERMRQYANAAAVPDDRIWSDIRAISEQLSAHP